MLHLVGFIVRIFHDARSPELQIHQTCQHDEKKILLYVKHDVISAVFVTRDFFFLF